MRSARSLYISENVCLPFLAREEMCFTLGGDSLFTPNIWKYSPHILSFEIHDYRLYSASSGYIFDFFSILNLFLDEVFL